MHTDFINISVATHIYCFLIDFLYSSTEFYWSYRQQYHREYFKNLGGLLSVELFSSKRNFFSNQYSWELSACNDTMLTLSTARA